MNIFITGASGCVGHYVIDELSKDPNNKLFLLVRDKKRVLFDPSRYTIIEDDMHNIGNHADVLADMDAVVHVATAWGDPATTQSVNFDATLKLFRLANTDKCKRIIYFSTASIVGRRNKVTPKALSEGTEYIQTKYLCYKELSTLPNYDKIVTVFPTWVFGGDDNHPFSHASSGIGSIEPWLNLFRWITIPGGFHFVHGKDIAIMVNYLLNNFISNEVILGNSYNTATDAIKEICAFYAKKIYFQISLSPVFILTLSQILGIRINSWDRYCIKHLDFHYDAYNPDRVGLKSAFPTLTAILQEYKENRLKNS